MKISAYLSSIEGTEQEPLFKSKMLDLTKQDGISQLLDKPGIGKMFTALNVLGESESIEDFRQTKYYGYIKDWGIKVYDLERGYFTILPGPKHIALSIAIAAAVGIGVCLWMRKKRRIIEWK